MSTAPTASAAFPARFDGDAGDDDFAAPLSRDIEERHALLGDDDAVGAGTPRWHLLLLLGFTLLGAGLRFFRIGHPTFWIDEAFTYWRVSGSYADLIDILREGGFTPLHYEGYWVLGQFTTLSPLVMRLIPAICGTLMIPAMYFLARQVARRDVALLVAAVACCSAYLLNYSRDAKMYMDAWFFATLHLGCFMWWLRTRRTIAWLGWVAAGLAMAGTHGESLVLLVIQPVLLLISRGLKWWHAVAFLGGVTLILAGPGGYYVMFNQWGARIEKQGWNQASGLMWVNFFNGGREGFLDHLRYPLSAYLFSWEWPKVADEPKIAPAVVYWYKTLAFTIFVLIVAGLFPWRTLVKGQARLHAGFVPRIENEEEPPLPEPWWRGTFWIASWIVLPPFAFFLVSAGRVVTPLEGLPILQAALDTPFKVALAALVLLAAFSCCGRTLGERLRKTAAVLTMIGALVVICWGMGSLVVIRNADSVWVPRYLGVIWPALAIAACTCILRLPGWPLRSAAIVLLLGLNLANGLARIVWHTQPPLDRVAADVVAGDGPGATTRTFVSEKRGRLLIAPGLLDPEGRYYLLQAATAADARAAATQPGATQPAATQPAATQPAATQPAATQPAAAPYALPGRRVKPREFLTGNFKFESEEFERAFGMPFNIGTSPTLVRDKVTADPNVRRVIVWEQFFAKPLPAGAPDQDPIAGALGAAWRRVDVKDYPIYTNFNFNWAWTHEWRRREYVRD